MVLHRTRSQKDVYATPVAATPYAAYPPDLAVQQLGQQAQQTYEQLMALHQQQQVQAQAQVSMNQ
ncbi:hypothetical protein H310_09755 [Aphanomyces invadans]|uniref:Uncharacterized protein n=1 Tax=Aphanomyces invadans TaxID=157072 RepID=A0A024TTG6_9STRA|nr:hypothetical protein H310_09755 [Aphanomyces invadans]ETV97425.1 hypothetical protein H310_09755 [Aphanomyces invadans]|eukprot:XP_008874133.1 hypothetical protein H310_09755 [Aphanomyces invadans]